MCFNKKVIGFLAAAGLAVYLFAPNLIGAALPLLLVAACPLSMMFMMRGMSGGQSKACSTGAGAADAGVEAELARLRGEVARLRSERSGIDRVSLDPPTR